MTRGVAWLRFTLIAQYWLVQGTNLSLIYISKIKINEYEFSSGFRVLNRIGRCCLVHMFLYSFMAQFIPVIVGSKTNLRIKIHMFIYIIFYFPDWLINRRHCNAQWQAASIIVREKIDAALQNLPEDKKLSQLLKGTCQYSEKFMSTV